MNTYFVLSFLTLSSFDSWLVAVARRAVAIAVNVFAAVVDLVVVGATAEAQHPTGLDFDLFARSFFALRPSVRLRQSIICSYEKAPFILRGGHLEMLLVWNVKPITFVLKSREM